VGAGDEDDLVLLRYILSKGSAAKAVSAIHFARRWRSDPKNRFYLELVRAGEEPGLLKVLAHFGLNIMSLHHARNLNDGGPVALCRPGAFNGAPLFDLFEVEELETVLNCMKEKAFIQCDEVTRETGKLTKLVVINDLEGLRILQQPPKKFILAFGHSTKLAENIYPQVLACNVMINYPRFVAILMRLAKIFLSQKLIEKFVWCKRASGDMDATKCPFVTKNLSPDTVPSFLGGHCSCPHGCIVGLPNDVKPCSREVTPFEIEAVSKAMVGVREWERIAITRFFGGVPIRNCFDNLPHADPRFLPFASLPATERKHGPHEDHLKQMCELHRRYSPRHFGCLEDVK
jgi:hypothetical protein